MDAAELTTVKDICPGANSMSEGGTEFVFLPDLRIPVGNAVETRDALLSLSAHSGYTSRLYISAPIRGKGQNWTIHTVLGRTWHTPSWNNVMPGRAAEMLQQHLRVYR
jgi:hypothetical protein